MTVEQRAEELLAQMPTTIWVGNIDLHRKLICEALRAHEAATIERCARECEVPRGQITNGSRDTIECAYGQALASRIRALAQKGNGNGD